MIHQPQLKARTTLIVVAVAAAFLATVAAGPLAAADILKGKYGTVGAPFYCANTDLGSEEPYNSITYNTVVFRFDGHGGLTYTQEQSWALDTNPLGDTPSVVAGGFPLTGEGTYVVSAGGRRFEFEYVVNIDIPGFAISTTPIRGVGFISPGRNTLSMGVVEVQPRFISGPDGPFIDQTCAWSVSAVRLRKKGV